MLIGSLAVACVAVSQTSGKDDPLAKVGLELRALYERYLRAQQAGAPFTPSDPLVRLVEDRVVIDATAAGDPGRLRADLVALGMKRAASAGRIVSGELPVSVIAAMAALPSLRFARAAASATQGEAAGGSPPHP